MYTVDRFIRLHTNEVQTLQLMVLGPLEQRDQCSGSIQLGGARTQLCQLPVQHVATGSRQNLSGQSRAFATIVAPWCPGRPWFHLVSRITNDVQWRCAHNCSETSSGI